MLAKLNKRVPELCAHWKAALHECHLGTQQLMALRFREWGSEGPTAFSRPAAEYPGVLTKAPSALDLPLDCTSCPV